LLVVLPVKLNNAAPSLQSR